MESIKFFFPLLGVCSGIFFSDVFSFGFIFPLFILATALLIWLVIYLTTKKSSTSFRLSGLQNIWIFLLFAAIGALAFQIKGKPLTDTDLTRGEYLFQGTITETSSRSQGDIYKVKISSVTTGSSKKVGHRNLHILLKTDGFLGNINDIIEFSGTPKDVIEIYPEDYASNLKHQGIPLSINLRSEKITVVDEESDLTAQIGKFRDKLIILIEKSNLSRATSEFIISIILGDKSLLRPETKDTLNSAGLAHILALSGMHVAIVFGIFMAFLFPLSLMKQHKLRYFLAILLVWGYVLLTGGAPSTIRAAIMATVIVISILLERKNSALNSLLFAVMIILIADPLCLWNIGLQLSFVCVASIILFVKKFNPVDRHSHPVVYKITEPILLTLVVTLSTWVIIAFYFGNIPLTFLPANLLIVPLLPLFMTICVIYITLLAIGYDAGMLSKILDFAHNILIKGAELFSFNGQGTISLEIPLFSVLLWCSGIFIFAIALYTIRKRYQKILYFISPMLLLSAIMIPYFSASNRLTKVDFRHSFTKMEAYIYEGKETINLNFPRNSISQSNFKDINILAIDNNVHPDSLKFLAKNEPSKRNFLILGPGAEFLQVKGLIENSNFEKILLHPSLGQKKKAELLGLLDESFWDNVHSLRENGSLLLEL